MNDENNPTGRCIDLPISADPTPMTGPEEGDEYYEAKPDRWWLYQGGKWIDNTDEEDEDDLPSVRIASPSLHDGNPTTKEILERRRERHGHIKRHFISGLIVFLVGLGADVGITHYILTHNSFSKAVLRDFPMPTGSFVEPRMVLWGDGTSGPFVPHPGGPLPPPPGEVILGAADDGRIVWRAKPK